MCPFIDTGGLPGPRNVLAEGNVLGKVRQFEWGQKKKVLENQTMAFTTWQETDQFSLQSLKQQNKNSA